MSARRLLGAHLPAVYPERRETVAGGVPGLTDAVRHRRAAAAAGGVAGLRGRRGDIEGPSPPGRPPFNALRIRRAT